jgi:hypothetical protein
MIMMTPSRNQQALLLCTRDWVGRTPLHVAVAAAGHNTNANLRVIKLLGSADLMT